MNRKYVSLFVIILSAAVAAAAALRGRTGPESQSATAVVDTGVRAVAAPGRVEPVSEEIEIRADIPGRLVSVPLEEGDRVHRGQVVATIENADYRAAVASARARLAEQEALLRRVENGSRGEERAEALAAVREADAVLRNARAEWARRVTLADHGVIAREEADRAEREFRVAESRHDAAVQRQTLVNDESRVEDKDRSRASVELARADVAQAEARLAKTAIHSPIDGIVLRKHLKAGEVITDQTVSPILTIADCSVLRVRIDIDEVDVARVRVGQAAWVTADAYGDAKFTGRVVRVGSKLGQKTVRVDEPVERTDQKILETLIELDPGQSLPVGLRVDAFVETR